MRIAFRPTCVLSALMFASALAGCSPTFDWRDTRFPEADGAEALFPCKPERLTRRLKLADEAVAFSLASCSAGTLTFALAHAEVADASRVVPALQELQDRAQANVGGAGTSRPATRVNGAAPEPPTRRIRWEGRRPDGGILREEAVFFVRGRHVFQASLVGTVIDAEIADTFFAGFKLPG